VWEFCDGNNTAADIFAQVSAIDSIPHTNSLEQEITELITELEESGFLLE
jgi:hypothetical protein